MTPRCVDVVTNDLCLEVWQERLTGERGEGGVHSHTCFYQLLRNLMATKSAPAWRCFVVIYLPMMDSAVVTH